MTITEGDVRLDDREEREPWPHDGERVYCLACRRLVDVGEAGELDSAGAPYRDLRPVCERCGSPRILPSDCEEANE